MLEKFTSSNSADFKQRYEHTYGWLHTSKKHFVYISRVTGAVTFFTGVDGESYDLRADSDYNFEFLPVTNGYFYTKNGDIYYLTRVPARQWRRGIADSNTAIKKLGGPREDLNIKVLHSIFDLKEQPYRYDPDKACALSRHFAITDDHKLQFRDNTIGLQKGNCLQVDQVFYQEIVDTNRRLGYKFTVEAV